MWSYNVEGSEYLGKNCVKSTLECIHMSELVHILVGLNLSSTNFIKWGGHHNMESVVKKNPKIGK